MFKAICVFAVVAGAVMLAEHGRGDASNEHAALLAKEAILTVLKEDKRLGDAAQADSANRTPSEIAGRFANYCMLADAIDLSACPPEFRVAYRQHLRAWRELVSAVRELPNGFADAALTGFINGLCGEVDGGSSRLVGGVKKAEERVRTTWEEVEKIGTKYGAAL